MSKKRDYMREFEEMVEEGERKMRGPVERIFYPVAGVAMWVWMTVYLLGIILVVGTGVVLLVNTIIKG